MKIGICTSMNPLTSDKTGIESAVLYSESGFDYLEFPAAQIMALSNTDKQNILTLVKEKTRPCLAFNNFFPADIKVTGNNIDKTRIQEYSDEVLEIGGNLGIETIVFGSSGARNLSSDFPFEKGWEQIVDLLSTIAPKAQRKNIVIVIEHLNRLESNIVTSFAQGVKLVKQINHPNIRCLLDHYHFNLGNEDFSLITENYSLISHIHFANVLGRTIPIPERFEEDGEKLLMFLKDKSYPYKMSIEGYADNLKNEITQVVPFIQKYLLN